MEDFLNTLKVPALVGLTSSLGGGLVAYLTKINTCVVPNPPGIFRNFVLVTTAAAIVEYGRKEKIK